MKYSQKKKGATYIYVVSLIEVLFDNVKTKSSVRNVTAFSESRDTIHIHLLSSG